MNRMGYLVKMPPITVSNSGLSAITYKQVIIGGAVVLALLYAIRENR